MTSPALDDYLRKKIDEIHESAISTARDMVWVKERMEKDALRVDMRFATADIRHEANEKRLRKVESQQRWYAGAGSMLGMILGALGVHMIKP